MTHIDEDLRVLFHDVSQEPGDAATQRVLASVPTTTPPASRHGRLLLGSAAAIAAVATITAVQLGSGTDSPPVATPNPPSNVTGPVDCSSALSFTESTYLMAAGTNIQTLPPGNDLGVATYGQCAGEGGGSDDEADTRHVFAVADVPSEQAILVTNSAGEGSLFINSTPPADGWDPDLQTILDNWEVVNAG